MTAMTEDAAEWVRTVEPAPAEAAQLDLFGVSA